MIALFVFDNNKYNKNNEKEYNTIIKEMQGTLVLELGKIKTSEPKPKKNYTLIDPSHISVSGVKKELLEYHYGIYRMFPCGKQYQYHMRFMHVPGVCERRIKG